MSGTTAHPPSWAVSTIEVVTDILDHRRVPVNANERAKRVGSVPYYGATGQVGWIDSFLFDEELVLLGEDGAPFLDPAKPKAYVIRGKAWVNNHAHVLRARGGMPSGFVKHQLDYIDYHGFVSGTTRLKLSQGPMRCILLSIPPLAEQHRILAALDSYFSRLDEAVMLLERVQRNLSRYRAAVLNAAISGKLAPTEAELARKEGRDYEPAAELLKRILVERRRKWEEAELARMVAAGKPPIDSRWKAKHREPVDPDVSGLVKLPEGWCWASIDQVAILGTGATPKRDDPRYWQYGTVPWVTSAVVNQLHVDAPSRLVSVEALRETNLTVYPPGTLLVAMYGEGGTRGRCTELQIESTTNQALAALVLEGEASGAKSWLRLVLDHSYSELRRVASGGVQPNLSLGTLRRTALPLPPLAEQERIARAAAAMLSIGDRLRRDLGGGVARIGRLKQAILAAAFRGALVDQDPSDEPATALLARIQSERHREESASDRPPRRKGASRSTRNAASSQEGTSP